MITNSLLYIIFILHQTATVYQVIILRKSCISSSSYIKPQQYYAYPNQVPGCISSSSYIKPQLPFGILRNEEVVYHLHPTSNRNLLDICILSNCCISSSSYIKPQRVPGILQRGRVVYHLHPTSNRNPNHYRLAVIHVVYHLHPTSNRNIPAVVLVFVDVVYHLHPTSNRNVARVDTVLPWLYIIFILHQTATWPPTRKTWRSCISSSSYIKPQRNAIRRYTSSGCISSSSYIKPQLLRKYVSELEVVYHLHPTSNRNKALYFISSPSVVYHLHPTSNRNMLHRGVEDIWLYIIFILHQTATRRKRWCSPHGCISSSSYIKPQRRAILPWLRTVVYHLHPTSNRNHWQLRLQPMPVVYHLHPTSNRNWDGGI